MRHIDGRMRGRKRLARGPLHPTTTQDMDVDVVHRLAAISPVVDDNPVAVGQLRLLSTLLGNDQQVTQQLVGQRSCMSDVNMMVADPDMEKDVRSTSHRWKW